MCGSTKAQLSYAVCWNRLLTGLLLQKKYWRPLRCVSRSQRSWTTLYSTRYGDPQLGRNCNAQLMLRGTHMHMLQMLSRLILLLRQIPGICCKQMLRIPRQLQAILPTALRVLQSLWVAVSAFLVHMHIHCVWTCMYTSTHTHIHTYIHIHTYTHVMHTYIHFYMLSTAHAASTASSLHSSSIKHCISKQTAHTHTHISMHIHFVYTCIYTSTHTHKYIHTHIHIRNAYIYTYIFICYQLHALLQLHLHNIPLNQPICKQNNSTHTHTSTCIYARSLPRASLIFSPCA